MLKNLDRDGDGVDKCEFVVGMLVAMGCANELECAALMSRFDELDKDGSGKLDSEDIEEIAQQLERKSAR